MNLRTFVISAALLVVASGFAGCQKRQDLDNLHAVTFSASLTDHDRDLVDEISTRYHVVPNNTGQTPGDSEIQSAVAEVVVAAVDAQLQKIDYHIRPLVAKDVKRLKELHGDSMYSILRDVQGLPETAQKLFQQWAYAAVANDPERYQFQQPSANEIQLIVTTIFEAGGAKMKQSNTVATVSFEEAKALTEYARKPASER